MKEDYLWDKTGADPEIEMLENALQAFRYRETALPVLPVLPAKVVPLKREPFYKGFRFALAAAACLTFGVLAFGVWFQILKSNIADSQASATATQNQDGAALPTTTATADLKAPAIDTAAVKNPNELPRERTGNFKQSSEPKFNKVHHAFPVNARRQETKAQNNPATKPEDALIRLTKEERYAYNQLMLALSITSSKLKMVKDKVEGLEEKNAVLKNGQ